MTPQNTTHTAPSETIRNPRGIANRLRPLIILGIAVALLSQSYLVASADDGGFITGPDRTRSNEATPLATLNLPNGDVMEFVEVRGDRSALIGFLVFSMVHRDSAGYQSIERLQDANALEVFNALTERGTPIPRELVAVHGRAKLGPQGWGIPLLLAADPMPTRSAVCHPTATYIYQQAMSYGLATYNNSFEAVTGASTNPQHWHKNNGPAFGFPASDLYGQANRVTSFSTAVALCDVDSWWYSYDTPVGNWVNVKVRQSGTSAWANWKAGQINAEYYLVHAELKLANYNMPSAMEFDFRLEIIAAEDTSLFRVGAAWHKKIGSIVLGQ